MENITYKFHVKGMHCKSCSLVIEQELGDLSYVEKVKTDIKTQSVKITGDFSGIPSEALAEDFSTILKSHRYVLSVEKHKIDKNWSEFKIAIPVALAFIAVFIFLQKIGLINLVNTNKMSLGTVFIIGVIASLSSCMAVVGGLLLSMSATFAKDGDKVKPQLMFHSGRLVSFFVLGGVIGILGSAFQLNGVTTFLLGLIIGLVMLLMGLNLLDVFHFTKKLQPSMPKFISKHALGVSKFNHTITPLLVGIVTFFLPCGFTQSMQIYTLSTGNFWAGALTMFAFALGTLPALALVSFSSFSIQNNSKSGIFFKSAGLIVIMFALFNIINSLVVIGVIPPVFNF
jgi:sulfite exporter TauE/SafE/copper chaperone CopZ